jgi:hypothetical protein
MWFSSVFHAKS